jgi:hypothetical protein
VPFITNRFRPNLHFVHRMCHGIYMWRFGRQPWLAGEIESKTLSSRRVKCPLLPTDFDQTFIASRVWEGAYIFDVSFGPLECEAR